MMMWFWHRDEKLLTIADEAIPNLKKYPIVPTSIVEIIPDERALAGFRARKRSNQLMTCRVIHWGGMNRSC